MYVHIHTYRSEGAEEGRETKEYIHAHNIHIYIPYVNRYLTMNQGVFPMVNVNAHDHAFIYTEKIK